MYARSFGSSSEPPGFPISFSPHVRRRTSRAPIQFERTIDLTRRKCPDDLHIWERFPRHLLPHEFARSQWRFPCRGCRRGHCRTRSCVRPSSAFGDGSSGRPGMRLMSPLSTTRKPPCVDLHASHRIVEVARRPRRTDRSRASSASSHAIGSVAYPRRGSREDRARPVLREDYASRAVHALRHLQDLVRDRVLRDVERQHVLADPAGRIDERSSRRSSAVAAARKMIPTA